MYTFLSFSHLTILGLREEGVSLFFVSEGGYVVDGSLEFRMVLEVVVEVEESEWSKGLKVCDVRESKVLGLSESFSQE